MTRPDLAAKAREIARQIRDAFDDPEFAILDTIDATADLILPALIAADADATERARKASAKVADALGDADMNDNLVNDDIGYIRGYEAAAREIASAIRNQKEPTDADA